MRTAWLLLALSLALSLALAGCSAAATPSVSKTQTPSATAVVAASPSAGAAVTALEGRWSTGPIPIDDIKASMVAAGITASDADGWIVEVGSPTRYSFLLTFTGTDFTHSQETPDSPMQEDESGTFTFSGTQLLLNIGDAGVGDTYTLQATLSGDELSLRYIDSTEQGTAEDKATHRRYTIAFYGSAVFTRQP